MKTLLDFQAMTKTLFSTVIAITAATALLLAGCGSSNDTTPATTDEAAPQVAATTEIWADVVRAATCGQVQVTSIIPPGADPHHYEPNPKDIIELGDAALVVVNGLNLEERLLDSLSGLSQTLTVADLLAEADSHDHEEAEGDHADHGDEAEDDHDHEEAEAGDEHDEHDDHADEAEAGDDHGHDHPEGLDFEHDHAEDEAGHDDHAEDEAGHDEHDDHAEDEDDHDDHAEDEAGHDEHDDHAGEDNHVHDHSGPDPHLWFDFRIAAELVEQVTHELESQVADPAALQECAANYTQELTDAEMYVGEQLASVPEANRLLVTQHQTLQRLADRFGYTILGSLIPSTSTLAESDVRNLIELEETIEETGVKAIFIDVSGDSSDADSFAEHVSVPVVELYTESLSDSSGPASSYLAMMRFNATQIAEALR